MKTTFKNKKNDKSAYEIAYGTINKNKLFKANTPLLLMVSGGRDSVALCYIISKFQNNKNNFAIMHLNHMLREEADDDQEFVKNLAYFFGVNYYPYKIDVKKEATDNHKNIEALGHELRYKLALDAKIKYANSLNINSNKIKICSAHTADDRIENFYMRSIVGTGPGGFASINYKNNDIVRPLLDLSKENITQYLLSLENVYKDTDNNIWHEDKTNSDTSRFRSYVRHNIIPLAKKQNSKMINNLCNSMNLIADESEYIDRQVAKIIDCHLKIDENVIYISPEFSQEELVLKRRCIYKALTTIWPKDLRIESKSIQSILDASETSNYTDNIQNNYSVHSNKNGVIVQPMSKYRKARKRI